MLNILDYFIIFFILINLFIGYKRGATLYLASFLGLIIGLIVGSKISLAILNKFHTANSTSVYISVAIVVSLLIFLYLSAIVGEKIKHKFITKKRLKIDKYCGVFLGLIGGSLLVWICALVILNYSSINSENIVLQSKILQKIDLQTNFEITTLNGFYLITPLKDNTKLNYLDSKTVLYKKVIELNKKSIVSIQHTGCGNLYSGSGYIVAPNLIVSAAHVVTGANLVRVKDEKRSYVGSVILYDLNRDLALIRVDEIKDLALQLASGPQKLGTIGILLGFPEQNILTASSGPIIKNANYSKLNVNLLSKIVIDKNTNFYVVNSKSEHGMSGGPLILSNGEVAGHLSFYSTSSENNSYVVSAQYYLNIINKNLKNNHLVYTGVCTP